MLILVFYQNTAQSQTPLVIVDAFYLSLYISSDGDGTNNGTVGTDCMWQGFVVSGSTEGENHSPANISKHGRLFLKGKLSQIRDAKIGILVGDRYTLSSYPNPAQNSIQLDYYLPAVYTNAQLEIYTLMGTKLHWQNLPATVQNHIDIPISHLPAGVYMVIIKQDAEILHKDKFNVIK